MTIKKYVSIQSLFYLFIYFSPILLVPFNLSKGFTINFTTVSYFIGALFLIVFNQALKKRPLIERRAPQTRTSVIILWGVIGVFLAFLTQMMAFQIESIFGNTDLSQNTQTIVNLIKQSPFFFLAVSIAGPIMEEFIFRRGIIGFLSEYLPLMVSAIISSVLFALVHADGHLLVYFSMGMVFYFLYQKTGSIWTSIIAHCSMNFLVMILQLSLN